MKKSQLRSGMLVGTKSGEILLVVGDNLIAENGILLPLSIYNDDLYSETAWSSIERVSLVINVEITTNIFEYSKQLLENNLLWSRTKGIVGDLPLESRSKSLDYYENEFRRLSNRNMKLEDNLIEWDIIKNLSKENLELLNDEVNGDLEDVAAFMNDNSVEGVDSISEAIKNEISERINNADLDLLNEYIKWDDIIESYQQNYLELEDQYIIKLREID